MGVGGDGGPPTAGLTSPSVGPKRSGKGPCDDTTMSISGTLSSRYPALVPSNDKEIAKEIIPGMGVKTSDKCGSDFYTRTVTCSKDPSHDRYLVAGTSCGDPCCPICYRTWIHRAADRVGCRIDGFRQFDRYPPKHVILSLDKGHADLDRLQTMPSHKALQWLRKYFKAKAEYIGLKGGVLVIHPWRTSDEVPRLDYKKKWQWVREQGADNFHRYVVFEPHAHIAGYGYLKTPLPGRFLYKNKGNLKTRDDIERWAAYTISHTAVIKGKTAVTYFGSCSYRKLRPTWIKRCLVDAVCSVCGAPMVYEGTNESYLVRKTLAKWIYVPDEVLGKTDNPKGPPGST